MDSIPQRTCSRCNQEFPATLEYFGRDKHAPQGMTAQCRVCRRNNTKNYRQNGASTLYENSQSAKAAGLKYCRKCDRSLPATNDFFAADITSSSGLRSYCKECGNKQTVSYKTSRRAEMLQYAISYYWQHRDAILLACKERAANNPEKVKARSFDYYWRDVDKSRARAKESYWLHADKMRERARIAANKRRSAEGSFSASDVRLLEKTQKGLCWWCGCVLNGKYHIDHRIALSRGGTNWPNNLCLACADCNLSKSSKLPHEWNGRLI